MFRLPPGSGLSVCLAGWLAAGYPLFTPTPMHLELQPSNPVCSALVERSHLCLNLLNNPNNPFRLPCLSQSFYQAQVDLLLPFQ